MRVSLEHYETAAYTAQVPRTWRVLADEVDRGDYVESRWRAPFPGHAELVIAFRKGSRARPDRIALAARGRLAADRTYSEVAFGPIALNGGTAQRWVYGLAGQQRVSWFINACGTSIAIYGTSRPSEFLRWAPTFRAVTASLQPKCG